MTTLTFSALCPCQAKTTRCCWSSCATGFITLSVSSGIDRGNVLRAQSLDRTENRHLLKQVTAQVRTVVTFCLRVLMFESLSLTSTWKLVAFRSFDLPTVTAYTHTCWMCVHVIDRA